MAVIHLAVRSNRETVEALEWALEESRHSRIIDVIYLFPGERGERAVLTGRYKADPAQALMAITRVSMALAQPR